MIKQNYYLLINEGHTMRLAGQMDDSRLYTHPTNLNLSWVGFFPVFNFNLSIDNCFGQYLVLVIGDDPVDAIIDDNVIISLN